MRGAEETSRARICVYGAGAVGGNFAVRLANAGHSVSAVARGAHLQAIRNGGLTMISGDARSTAKIVASADPADLGEQDLVIATLKGHALPDMAARIAPLLGPDTVVLFAQNGIPWWYADGLSPSRPAPPDLSALDPGGMLRRKIGIERTLGAVIYSSNDLVEPGVVKNNSPSRNRLIIGEVDDRDSDRVRLLRRLLSDAGIESPPCDDLRQRLWDKLIANIRASILAFLTEQTSREVFDDPDLRPIVDRLGADALAIASAHGITCVIDQKGPAAGHKSSMLQDYEKGRPQEIYPLITMPQAFGEIAGVSTPTLDTIAGLARAKAAARRQPA